MNEPLTLAQALSNFHFLRPLWLLALLPALFFFRRLWHLDAQGSAWHKVIDQNLLPYLLNVGKNASQRVPLYLLLAIWTLSIVALAGPTWTRQAQPVQQRQDSLVIVLDLSVGMFANDFEPNRITVARRKLMDILDMRREGQTALVVYAGEAHMVTPLTDDSVSIRAMVPALNPNIMPMAGNNPSHAIAMARALMDEAATVNGRILLLTGGFTADQNNAIQDAMSGSNYPLHIIGIGSSRGGAIPASNGEFLRDTAGQLVVAAMDRDNLNSVASRMGGLYRDISINSTDLDDILADSLTGGEADYLEAEEQVELWQDAGPWLLWLLVPLCAFCFRRGWILQIAIAGSVLLFVPTQPLMAQEPSVAAGDAMPLEEIAIGAPTGATQLPSERGFRLSDLWRNRDQRGLHSFREENNPATAATLFEDPSWRGAAHYRSGNYEAAVLDFSQRDDLDSKFNLGNALAYAQRFEESIAAYQSVLDVEPEHADALKNKAIVESLLQQQQQQEQEQQEQNQEQQPEADDQAQQTDDQSEETEAMENEQQEQQEPQQQQQQESEEQQQQEDQQSDSNNNPNSQQRSSVQVEEDQESLEQFLRRIEDDPGELLQRKFQFESRRRMIERRAASQGAR